MLINVGHFRYSFFFPKKLISYLLVRSFGKKEYRAIEDELMPFCVNNICSVTFIHPRIPFEITALQVGIKGIHPHFQCKPWSFNYLHKGSPQRTSHSPSEAWWILITWLVHILISLDGHEMWNYGSSHFWLNDNKFIEVRIRDTSKVSSAMTSGHWGEREALAPGWLPDTSHHSPPTIWQPPILENDLLLPIKSSDLFHVEHEYLSFVSAWFTLLKPELNRHVL